MHLPHMTHIDKDSIEGYIQLIDERYERGVLSTKEYHAGLGKAWAYVEAQFALEVISEEEAESLINKIDWLLTIS